MPETVEDRTRVEDRNMQAKSPVQLPNGDLWRPRYADGSGNVSLDDNEAPSGEEAVEEAVAQPECPWCGFASEDKKTLRAHITKQHSENVKPAEEKEKDAARAMARGGKPTPVREATEE